MKSTHSSQFNRFAGVRACLFLAVAIFANQGHAQEPVVDEGGHKLTLGKVPDIEPGVASLLSGSAGPEGDKFYIENLTMFQPAQVILMAADPNRPLKLNLAKYRYGEYAWSGETNDSGFVGHRFRTQGELKIHVMPANAEASGEADYFLIAWAAELPKPADLQPPVEVIDAAGGSGGAPGWVKIGGGVLALVVVAAVFFRMGRKS